VFDVKIPIFHGSHHGLEALPGEYIHISYDWEMSAFIIITRLFQTILKFFPVLNRATCHENVWGNGGVSPQICNLGE
jgi:hypothetical protein